MNLQRAYILLAIFYTGLLAVGLVAMLIGGGPPLALFQLALGGVAIAGLWGYFLERPVFNCRTWQPFAGLLVVSMAAQMWLIISASPSSGELTWLLAGLIFSAPAALLLFHYGQRDQDLWATTGERQGGQALAALLEQQQELEVDRQQVPRPASVRITHKGDHYRASVIRGQGETAEHFVRRFQRPATLAFFIERFTCLEIGDFVAKYRDEEEQRAEATSG
ncbi:hypothetical protein OM427_21110 [Halomonas sp. 18H]|uniref:hypothetical protein n=1 Tax=Halomonas almeriensis TaxID=308163 RepID=UPI00222F7DDF|nr:MULTISPECIES: hypothetical protein [Halomonas]MCW4152021.1 hypothetical protein [Halomonas sp. 18H]MDN3552457.1 hypothetical protein [Halomonas almeriensis]